MQPNKRTLQEFIFRTDGYFQIPDFQRPYTWEGYQIDTFLSDLEKVVSKQNTHYFGTVVLVKEGDHSVIIDGQQRLTTSLLLITAIYHILQNNPEKSINYTHDRIKEQYLVNTYSSNAANRNRITLRTVTTDNNVLEKIFNGSALEINERANKLFKAYTRFHTFLSTKDNVDIYIDSLKKFEIVEIVLDKNDDNPQLVFENINSTGEPLSAGDKIRNWALMLNNEDARNLVYNSYWKRIENKLTRVEKNEQKDYISDFFRTYLMCKQNVFISDANTYPEFKTLLQQEITLDHNIENIKLFYNDILKYLEPYLSIKFMDIQPELTIFKEQIFSLKFLQIEVITPFIVNIFVDFLEQKLTTDEVSSSLNLIETYLTRRIICGLDSSGLNKVFAELHKALRSKQSENLEKTYDDCLSAWLLEKNKRTVVLPTNAEITNAVKNLNFYSIKTYNQQFVLAKICDQSKESALLHQISDKTQKLSIEHIMPQKLTRIWQKDLGENWELVYNKWLNTLSNLTLTAYNSEYSNRSFSEKKSMHDGFSQSPFSLNRYVANFNVWNEDSLEERTLWLAEQIEKIWKFPTTTLPLSADGDNDNYDEVFTPYSWEYQANMNPTLLFIDDDIFKINKWIDLYRKAIQFIYENHLEKFAELIDNVEFFGVAKRPLITTDETIPNRAGEFSHGIFIELNLSSQAIMGNLKKICEYVGFTENDCPISFKVENR